MLHPVTKLVREAQAAFPENRAIVVLTGQPLELADLTAALHREVERHGVKADDILNAPNLVGLQQRARVWKVAETLYLRAVGLKSDSARSFNS